MKNKIFTKEYIIANILLFGTYMVANLFLASISIYIKNLTGSNSDAGLMTTVFTIGCLATRFIAGQLLDKYGNKKIIFFGMVMMAIATGSYLFNESFVLALIFRTIQGAGFSIASTGATSYITRVLHPDKLIQGIGYTNTVMMVTGAISPTIAFALIGDDYSHFMAMFIVATIVATISTVLTIILQDIKYKVKPESHEQALPVEQKVKWNMVSIPVSIIFLNSLTQCGIATFISLYMISLDIPGAGIFLTMNATGGVIATLTISYIARAFGNLRTSSFFSLVFCLSVGSIVFIESTIVLMIISVIAGYAMASLSPIFNVYIIHHLPESRVGLANALFYSAKDLGFCIGGIFWGVIASMFGYSFIFLTGAILQALAGILCIVQKRITKE